MDQVKSEEIVKIKITHNFFCDGCNKLLGSSVEYEDGYYDHIGEYEHTVFFKHVGKFTINKCLCDNCRLALDKKIQQSMEDLGFTRSAN